MTKKVIKRDGTKVDWDISKIRKQTTPACEGTDINPLEFESLIDLDSSHNMKSADIQEKLILISKNNVSDENPDWDIVSGRCMAHQLQREVWKNTKFDMNQFNEHLDFLIRNGYYRKDIKDNYSKEDLNTLQEKVTAESTSADYNLRLSQIALLKSKYLLKNKKGILEYPSTADMANSMILASIEEESKRAVISCDYYEMLSRYLLSLATPFKANLRIPGGNTGSCFKGFEKVFTSEGYKEIKDVSVGDKVLTHMGRFREVYELKQIEHSGNYISLNIFGRNKDISATSYHPILSIKSESINCIRRPKGVCVTKQGDSKYCYKMKDDYKGNCAYLDKDFRKEIKWNPIGELGEGDYVSISYNREVSGKTHIDLMDYIDSWFEVSGEYIVNISGSTKKYINRYIELDEKFMTFIGYYIAEGHCAKKSNKVILTFGSHETEYIDECKNILNGWGFHTQIYIREDGSTNIIVVSKILKKLLMDLVGTYFNKKEVSKLMEIDPKYQIHLLKACMRGDGTNVGYGMALTLCNGELVNQLFEMALRCKLSPYSYMTKQKQKEHYSQPYMLIFSGMDNFTFLNLVGKHPHKTHQVKKVGRKDYFWVGEHYFMRIKNTESAPINEMVYNLEVKEDHSYSVNGVDVHNCFIGTMPDNTGGIFKSYMDMAVISGNGGGIGWYVGKVRPGDAYSPRVPKANVITKWIKIINDIAVAVNQRGIRNGAITPAIDWWHLDCEVFTEIKSELNGDLRDKCFDIFPQVVVDNYFLRKVKAKEEVYQYDQYEFKQLTGIDITELIGEKIEEAHKLAEELILSGKLKHFNKIKAGYLWGKMLKAWIEYGDFYISNKDNINISNYMSEFGIAHCVNLCVESFSLAKEVTKCTIELVDGYPYASETDGLYHSCNLISINVANILNDDILLKRVCANAVRMLDASIDLGTMPVLEAKKSAELLRNIGIGVVGMADYMAWNKVMYDTDAGRLVAETLMEKIAYYCYNASIELAIEKGSYPGIVHANYDKLFGKTPEELTRISPNKFDWVEVQQRIIKHGIRNFLILAIAPNTSSGLVQGVTASYLPAHSKNNTQKLNGLIVPVLPKFIKERFWFYKTKFQYKTEDIIKFTKVIQRWVDTGVSMELTINPDLSPSIKSISDEIIEGMLDQEIKAVYYSLTIDGTSHKCEGCAN